MTCSCSLLDKKTKIFRCIQTIENDRLDPQAIVSLELTMNHANGWNFHSIQHAGTQSDKSELHRYVIVFEKEVTVNNAIDYVLEDILKEDISQHTGKSLEDIVDYIHEKYEKKIEENSSEIEEPIPNTNNISHNTNKSTKGQIYK